ncbi:MAG: phosphomannomutase/phosphoglucomutase [Gammaproteobacteria bacterium]|nr:phosphomannomutase/phosphoglucomutase [Gammaproteobacteria bacterium]MCF6260044.1 phosphomannomutase/phosphoglucomutase [Gammaproteobacteria bacterium]
MTQPPQLDASIFKAYDVRGIVDKTLTEDAVYWIGRALGAEAEARGEQHIYVARDGRLSGPKLIAALTRGLTEAGRDVTDLGMAPTPVLYYAAYELGSGSGIMITGSHNPPEYNGLKMVLGGTTLSGPDIQQLRKRIESGTLSEGSGSVDKADVVTQYIERITRDVKLAKPMKVIVDCGNGVAGGVAPQLLRALGCEVSELFCDVDGNFPNHHPDPSKPENLADLKQALAEQQADIGLAFDGDGDRLGVLTPTGNVIWADRQMMLYAQDVLSRNPGAEIIYDIKCTTNLHKIIEQAGGKATMWKTGHSFIKAKLKESGAQLAGEMSGHIFFKERWYGFDDATYTASRLLEILSKDGRSADEIFNALPDNINTPELNMNTAEGENHPLVERLVAAADFPNAKITTIDGLRVDFDDGFGLVRASNTTPCLVFRFEATNETALARIQEDFRTLLTTQAPEAELPF